MNTRALAADGVALIEVLVALCLFALIATPTARTIAIAQRSRVSSGRWMRAAELAIQTIERLRAGAAIDEIEETEGFTTAWTKSSGELAGVDRCDVAVQWIDGEQRELVLTTLLRTQP